MIICYSGRSKPSALKIAEHDSDIDVIRGNDGDVNWGRSSANTRLNPDISNSTNKRVMRELFAEHDVPMPKLYGTNLSETGDNWDFPIVGRPDNHSKGRGFWLVKSLDDYARALRGTRKKKPATHFMEFVEADREYRVHIFKGKSIRISEKSFCDCGDARCKDYTTAKPQHDVKEVRKAAKKAVKALGLDFGAVDILATDDKCWVLEVNCAPGLGGSMPQLYAETFKKWYENA